MMHLPGLFSPAVLAGSIATSTAAEALMPEGFLSRITAFAKRPFSEDMDVWGWVLFLGFVIVLTILWNKVLANFVEE